MNIIFLLGLLFFITASLTSCSLAPTYVRPPMPIPTHYKEAQHWIKIRPNIMTATPKSPWWTLYNDEILNQLEKQVTLNNEHLKLALSQYKEARAIAGIARSAMYPTVISPVNGTRQQYSQTLASNTDDSITLYNTFTIAAVLNYEIDAWKRVENSVLSANRLARASKFDMAAISLSMHAELANNYFQLRSTDASIHLLTEATNALEKLLYLTKKLHQGGATPQVNVLSAVAELQSVKTLTTDMKLKRATFEHAIAVLIGEIPSNFSIAERHVPFRMVHIKPSLPSTLLTRRPDIAAAADRVEAQNALIGVARAAFFPKFNLSGMIGQQSSELSNLFTKPSNIWALGPSSGVLTFTQSEVTQTLFDGFKREAQLAQAKSAYFETVSTYRQTVLHAFQEVEDALVSIHRLEEENQTQTQSAKALELAFNQAQHLYHGGASSLGTVLIAEYAAIKSKLNTIDIRTRRQIASVQLIKALGGGWYFCVPAKAGIHF